MNAPLTPELFTAKLEPSGQQCDAWADQTLLDSIEMGGLNWPSSCRNGTCRTCLGTLTAGSVHYKIDWPGLIEVLEGLYEHIQREDNGLFPAAAVILDADDWERCERLRHQAQST